LGDSADGVERLANAGIQVTSFAGQTQLVNVRFRSQAERLGLEAGQTVTRVLLPNAERPPQELLYLPAFLLIAIVVALQWRRREWDQPGMPRRPLAA